MARKKIPAGLRRREVRSATNSRLFQRVIYRRELLIEISAEAIDHGMIASEIPAAINPYSMAVAPDSSVQNFVRKRFM